MIRKSFRSFAFLIVILAVMLASCATPTQEPAPVQEPAAVVPATEVPATEVPVAAEPDSVLRVARLADHFNFFHPIEFQTGNQFQWFNCVFNTLIKVEADSKTVVPDLADSWEVSTDGTVYTFNLNKDASWHDGTPFTADDVVFTINWYANNSTIDSTGALASAYKGFQPKWKDVAGAKEAAGTTKAVSGVEKVDDHTVKITVSTVNAEFLTGLADAANIILPAHILKDATAADVATLPFTVGTPGVTIGTGPYKLTAFTADQLVELVANPDYFKGAPGIDRVVFKLFADPTQAIAQIESGDLDLAFRIPPAEYDRLGANPNLKVISAKNPGVFRFTINTTSAPWDKVEIRQAIAYAINKQAIVDSFYKGRAVVLYNHPGFKVYDDINKYDYDPAKAAELLKTGGYAGEPFNIVYDGTFPDAGAIMPLIQADLVGAGIDAVLAPTDGAQSFVAALAERSTWAAAIGIGGSEALTPDRTKQYYNPVASDTAGNSNYTNPRIFELWKAGVSTVDPAARDEAYHELALILNTDLPMIHLYSPNLVMASANTLGGGFDIHLNERETFMDVETWTLAPAN